MLGFAFHSFRRNGTIVKKTGTKLKVSWFRHQLKRRINTGIQSLSCQEKFISRLQAFDSITEGFWVDLQLIFHSQRLLYEKK